MLELALGVLLAASCGFAPPQTVGARGVIGRARPAMPRVAAPHAAANALSDAGADGLALHRLMCERAEADDEFGVVLRKAMGVCTNAIRLYGPNGVVTSFNGGKDAVAILHLMRAALAQHDAAAGTESRLQVIFFEQDDEFPTVNTFVNDTLDAYGLSCYRIQKMGFADGLRQVIEQSGSGAFVLGTRATDPNAGGQQAFEPSSDWMPPFMRVNPVLNWEYAHVWTFLREFGLPYCSLYDQGYTSLGKMSNTLPNPALLRPDGTYGAARDLQDESLERAGRSSSKPAGGGAGGASRAAEVQTAASRATAAARASEPIAARTAALLIVGDEILRGKTRDSNTAAAVEKLTASGVQLQRVVVVPDCLDAIREELGRMSAVYDVVITSGGVGPTHDDVTIKGVAAALETFYEPCDEMRKLIEKKMPTVTPEVRVLSQSSQ